MGTRRKWGEGRDMIEVPELKTALAWTNKHTKKLHKLMQRFPLLASLPAPRPQVTDALLKVVGIADEFGLKLPREFGLLVKQVLYFDRYLKVLAPDLDVASDDRVRGLGNEDTVMQVDVIR